MLPIISAGMLRQQIRHLQALQKHQQGARSGSMPLPASDPAALAESVSCQQPASAVASEQPGHCAATRQQPQQRTTETHTELPAHAAVSLAKIHPSVPPSQEASQQPGSHSLGRPANGAVAQLSSQGAHASAAQAPSFSAVCCDYGDGQRSACISAVPRQQEVWPGSAPTVPRPSAHREQPPCPAAQLSHSTCYRASQLAMGRDSSAAAHSVPGDLEPGGVGRSAIAQAPRMLVHPEKPGKLPPYVSINLHAMGPHSGAGGMAGIPWQALKGGGLLGPADAAVTVQLLPAVKAAVGSTELTEKAQVWRTVLSCIPQCNSWSML